MALFTSAQDGGRGKVSDHRVSATLQVGRILAPGATAYDILGVKQDATPAEMKKRSVLQFRSFAPFCRLMIRRPPIVIPGDDVAMT